MVIRITANKVKTTRLTALYKDFKPEADPETRGRWWQEAYFDLLAWKNTWGLHYELDIFSSRKDGAFVSVAVKAENGEYLKDYMEGLGYGNVQAYEEEALVIDEEELYDIEADAYYIR